MPDGSTRFGGTGQAIGIVDQGLTRDPALAVDARLSGVKSTPATLAITASAQKVLDPNPQRKIVHFANNGTTTIFLGKDNSVTTAAGFPIPAGGSHVDVASGDAWYAIGTAGGDLRYYEVT